MGGVAFPDGATPPTVNHGAYQPHSHQAPMPHHHHHPHNHLNAASADFSPLMQQSRGTMMKRENAPTAWTTTHSPYPGAWTNDWTQVRTGFSSPRGWNHPRFGAGYQDPRYGEGFDTRLGQPPSIEHSAARVRLKVISLSTISAGCALKIGVF